MHLNDAADNTAAALRKADKQGLLPASMLNTLGAIALARGHYDDARILLLRSLSEHADATKHSGLRSISDKASASTYVHLGLAHYYLNNPSEARKMLSLAASLPRSPLVSQELKQAHRVARRKKVMKKSFAHLMIGSLLLLAAAGMLSHLAAQEPDTAEEARLKKLYKEPLDAFKEGKFDKSFEKLKELSKDDPTLSPARLTLARWLLSNQQTLQAGRSILEIAIAENSDHPEVYLQNASIALSEGRITEGLLNCQFALQLADGPKFSGKQRREFKKQARGGLATAFESRKQWLAAKGELTGWLELDEKNSQVRQRLARAIFMTDDPKGAYEELQAAVKDAKEDAPLDPPEVSMALLYASIEPVVEDEKSPKVDTKDKPKDDPKKKAEEWFGKAITASEKKDFKGKKARVYQAYAGWLLDTGRIKDAAAQITKAAELDPDSRETLALQGLEARYNHKWVEAESKVQ